MNQPLGAYIEWVELMTFYPGYLFVFALFYLLAGRQGPRGMIRKKMPLFSLAYALVATLYWGLLLKNWYPGYEVSVIKASVYHPFLRIWGLAGILVWIPYIYKRPIFPILHSLVFFALLLRDMFLSTLNYSRENISRINDLRIYGASIVINLGSLALIVIISIISNRMKSRAQSIS